MLRTCETCGREFNAKPYDVRRGFGRFCSRVCGRVGLRTRGRTDAWRYFSGRDGRWYRKWREPGSRKLHQQLEHRWVWEQSHGPIPDGYEVHHRDRNPLNNDLANLQLLTAAEHDDYHQRLREDHRVVAGVEQRRCQRCDEYKPPGEFQRRRAGTYQGYCKPCQRDALAEWRARNRERHVAYMRGYRERT